MSQILSVGGYNSPNSKEWGSWTIQNGSRELLGDWVTSGANRLQLNPIHRVGAPFIGPKGTLRYNVRFTPGTVSIRTLDLMPFIRGIVACPSHYTTRYHMTLLWSLHLCFPGLSRVHPSFRWPSAFIRAKPLRASAVPRRTSVGRGGASAHLCRQGRSHSRARRGLAPPDATAHHHSPQP
jgi:hypothetical protein